jgi:hypothetical protein
MISCSCIVFIVFIDEVCSTTRKSISKPYFVFLNIRKKFFIGDCILIPYDDKFLLIFEKLSDILSKERKWRIGHHDICLFQYLDTLWTTEVTILLQWSLDDIEPIHLAIMIPIADYLELVRWFLGLVVSRDEFLNPEIFEIHLEVPPKVTLLRVITVTEDNLISEMPFIVFEFFLDIRKLSIEFILFIDFRLAQVFTS